MFFVVFLQFGWISGEVFVAVSDNFRGFFFGHENSRRATVFDVIAAERLEIAARFVLKGQNRVLTYFLGQNGPN